MLDQFWVWCDDGSCCCMSSRTIMAVISIINLIATVLDTHLSDTKTGAPNPRSIVLDQVFSLKTLLVTVYQMANILLLVAATVESAALVQVFVWYTLGFTVMSLMITIAEYVLRYKYSDVTSFIEFVVEVSFLFVTFRCLPLVDTYRKHLDSHATTRYY